MNYPDRVSVFSGIDLSIDAALGRTGRCDFILARNPLQLELAAPACVLVEAKNENILAGVPQCLAEMVAAQRFNRAAGIELEFISGVVTTGFLWRFLRLSGANAHVDGVEYSMDLREKIYGILTHIALGTTSSFAHSGRGFPLVSGANAIRIRPRTYTPAATEQAFV